jgi:alpha-NAC-related protein
MMNINSKQIEKVMKQMGMSQEEIEADRVVIEQGDKNLIIENPQVSRVKMKGQETFQIVGTVVEEEKESFSEEDVKMVVEKTGASEDDVKVFLKENDGDIAKAILELKQ